jgi:hypothetical protein
VDVRVCQAITPESTMAEDALREFAHTLAAKAAHIKADATSPEDALFAIGELMHEAKRDPAGWLAANRYRPPAGRAEQKPQPTPADIWHARARQVGGGR